MIGNCLWIKVTMTNNGHLLTEATIYMYGQNMYDLLS